MLSPSGQFPQIVLHHQLPLDLQTVNISLRVLSRPDSNQLPTIYRRLSTDYDERVLPSIVNEVKRLDFESAYDSYTTGQIASFV